MQVVMKLLLVAGMAIFFALAYGISFGNLGNVDAAADNGAHPEVVLFLGVVLLTLRNFSGKMKRVKSQS
jgi:hypothetical protein